MDKLKEANFESELSVLLNKHSIDSEVNTPDFILAQYLLSCLAALTPPSL